MNRRTFLRTAITLPGFALPGPGFEQQTHDHGAMPSNDGEFNPFVISDNRGGFLMACVQRNGGQSNVVLQRSQGGSNFSTGARINNRLGDAAVRNENPPKLAVGPNSEIYAVWASERERWKGNIRFARSLNGGKSFEPAISLNSDADRPPIGRAFQSIVVDAKGRIFVAWIDERNKREGGRGAEIWMAVSEDRGNTFSRDRKILQNVCECCRVTLDADTTGNLYVSYRSVSPSGSIIRDIAVARSSDGGKTFRSAMVHRDGWDLNACPIAGATMTVDGLGRVHVVWFTQSGDLPRLYAATSTDHGVTFSKPSVFDPNQKLAKHAHAVSTPDHRVLIAWDDIVDGVTSVKWGLYKSENQSMTLLGIQRASSYPIVAASGSRISLVALQPDRPEVFRTIRTTGSK